MSDRWMPAMDSVPPRSRACMAGSTRSPTGANRIAASSGSGGMSAASPTLAAPSSRASCLACSPRVSTWTVAPRASAVTDGDPPGFGALTEGGHLPHHLVAGGDAGLARLQVALGHVQVGTADAAGQDLEQQLARSRPWRLVVGVQAQRTAGDRPR